MGWGATGPDIGPHTEWTLEQADARLAHDLDEAAGHVDYLVQPKLTANELGALASFVFNLGAGAFASSTLLRRLNAGDIAGAEGEFPRWVRAGGRVLDGLVKRRAAEALLFQGLDWRAALADDVQPHPMPQMLPAPEGDEDDRVCRIQRVVGVKVDGVYGPATRRAVAAWQQAHGLVADGVVGPKTAAKMGIG